ncbi:type III PLP-dependent enzyme [Paenibacillus sp. LHD-117]|uniref:type III PLP-dependent enzyme n=1 Tax=Paenibacillus sp. LHD-117 TaxID=3071412 RepID=UPI0027DF0BB0|nr:type III PLP-dependent enzyme [Paenibacillus sp. LHD-117]MDQ6421981.1 type III PLP-dependent enzyme [Paenibacillus sp. LHD-117]
MKRISNVIHSWKRDHPGEPFSAYIYDLGELKRHAARIVATLPAGAAYYYAIKANSDPKIIEALLSVAAGFEVASLGEAEKVREVSREASIIFGGPGKTDDEIENALRLRVSLLHVESTAELLRVNWIAERLDLKADILLRVNLRGPLPAGTLQMCGVPSQFGIDEADIPQAIELAQSCSYVALKGFHFHSLSNHLDAHQHAAMVGHYIERARHWQSRYGFDLHYVNAGGGVGINYEHLESPFDWESFVQKLGQIIGQEAGESAPSLFPEILFECGRYTVASCGYYAAEVLDIKRIGGSHFAVVNGGLHHFLLPGAWKHRHPLFVVPVESWPYPWPRMEIHDLPVTIVGRMNSTRDILARNEPMTRLRAGDVLVFPYAGAYGWSISAHGFSSLEHPQFFVSKLAKSCNRVQSK